MKVNGLLIAKIGGFVLGVVGSAITAIATHKENQITVKKETAELFAKNLNK